MSERYENEVGRRALGLYANDEHVKTIKALLIDIMDQINKNCSYDGLDELDVADHVGAALLHLAMDVAEETQHMHGQHRMVMDLQDLTVTYGLNHLV